MKSMKKLILVLVMAALIGSLTACSNSKDNKENKAKEPKKLTKMSIVLDWYPNAIHSFLYNAIDNGYFKEEGIELEILFPANVNDGISMPATGKADFGIYYMKPIIQAKAEQNVPVKSIGTLVQKPLNVILSRAESNIKTPKDLEGKKIGYAGSPMSVETIKEMMKKSGANPENTEFIDVGFDLLNALTTKKVDATTDNVENHELPMLKKKGLKINTMYTTEFGIPNYYEMSIVCGDKTLKEKKELVDGFLRAITKGFEDMKNKKKASLDNLFKYEVKDQFPLDRTVEEQSLEILLPKMQPEGTKFLQQDEKVWQDNINWMKKLNIIKKDVKAKDLIYKANIK